MTANQMKWILAFLHQPKGEQNQSKVARIFGVNKSNVSRAINEAVNQGLLTYSDASYELTGYGEEYIKAYEYRLDRISEWLKRQGVDSDSARNDSFTLMEVCSEKTLKLLQDKGSMAKIYNNLEKVKNSTKFQGEEILKYIDEGEYQLPFTFYKISGEGAVSGHENIEMQSVSMANAAFCHPAVLSVSKAGGDICLRIKSMIQKSKANSQKIEGRLKTIKYQMNKKEKIAMLNDEKVYIPIEAMNFLFIKEDNILKGYMKLTMSCTVGEAHMPESAAVLVVNI